MFEDETSMPGREEKRQQGEVKLLGLAVPGHQGLGVMLGFCLVYKSKEMLLKGLGKGLEKSDSCLEKTLWLQYEEVRARLGQMRLGAGDHYRSTGERWW